MRTLSRLFAVVLTLVCAQPSAASVKKLRDVNQVPLVGLAVTDGSPGHRIFKEGTSKHGFGFIYRDCTAPPGVTMQITSIAAKAGSENAPTGNPQDYPYVVAFASIDSSVFDWDGSPLAISWTLQSGEVLGIKSNYREVRIQGFAYTRESVTIVNLTCVNVPLK